MTSTTNQRPSWQDDACPSWCVVDHHEDDFPEDRFHDSRTLYVSVTLGVASPPHPEPTATPAELYVITSRRAGSHRDWTFVGEPDRSGQRLVLSRESARHLIDTLTEHLDALE